MSRKQPPGQTKSCAVCGAARGNVKQGWNFIVRDGRAVGVTCSACPRWDEPIRREDTGGRVRFVAVVNGGTDSATGKTRQLKRRFDRLDDARQWVSETRSGVQRRRGGYVDPSRFTVRQITDRWIVSKAEQVGVPGGIREVTLNGYKSAVHGLLLHIGDRAAREVTPGEVERTLRTLATVGGKWGRPLSHRSITYALVTLRQVFNHAVREGWVVSNPAALARPPRESHGDGSETAARLRWSPAELARFRQHVDDYSDGDRFASEPWIRAAMRLTLCGLRRSEVLGLDWERVDRGVGTVTVAASRVKTGRGTATQIGEVKSANGLRVVNAEAIHPGTAAALRDLWIAQGQPDSGLVIRDAAGEPVAPDLYSARFRALCRDAGLPVLRSIHNARHTIATALKAAGVPDHEAAALLGHDVATFQRFYLVTDSEGAASAAVAAGKLFAV